MDFKYNRVGFDNKSSVSQQKNSKIKSEFIFTFFEIIVK